MQRYNLISHTSPNSVIEQLHCVTHQLPSQVSGSLDSRRVQELAQVVAASCMYEYVRVLALRRRRRRRRRRRSSRCWTPSSWTFTRARTAWSSCSTWRSPGARWLCTLDPVCLSFLLYSYMSASSNIRYGMLNLRVCARASPSRWWPAFGSPLERTCFRHGYAITRLRDYGYSLFTCARVQDVRVRGARAAARATLAAGARRGQPPRHGPPPPGARRQAALLHRVAPPVRRVLVFVILVRSCALGVPLFSFVFALNPRFGMLADLKTRRRCDIASCRCATALASSTSTTSSICRISCSRYIFRAYKFIMKRWLSWSPRSVLVQFDFH